MAAAPSGESVENIGESFEGSDQEHLPFSNPRGVFCLSPSLLKRPS
jgi:hypothetical protein